VIAKSKTEKVPSLSPGQGTLTINEYLNLNLLISGATDGGAGGKCPPGSLDMGPILTSNV